MYCYDGVFCACCGMALRVSLTARKDREKLRELLQRLRRISDLAYVRTRKKEVDLGKWVELSHHFVQQV
jgi:hypothetical protein